MHTEISVHTDENEGKNVSSDDSSTVQDIEATSNCRTQHEMNSYDMRVESLEHTYTALSAAGNFFLWYGKNKDGKRIDADGTILEKGKRRADETYGEKKCKYHSYYQLANRLTFLKYLRDEGYNVRLVLLNFVHDYTHGMNQGENLGA